MSFNVILFSIIFPKLISNCTKFTWVYIDRNGYIANGKCCGKFKLGKSAYKWWPLWFWRRWNILRRLGRRYEKKRISAYNKRVNESYETYIKFPFGFFPKRKSTWAWSVYGTKTSGRIFRCMELWLWSVWCLHLAKVILIWWHYILCHFIVANSLALIIKMIRRAAYTKQKLSFISEGI